MWTLENSEKIKKIEHEIVVSLFFGSHALCTLTGSFVCLFGRFENDWWNVSAAVTLYNAAAAAVGNKLSFHIQFNHLWIYLFIVWLQEIIWYKYAIHNTHR